MMGVQDMPQMKSLSPGPPLSPSKPPVLQDMELIEALWKQDVDLGFSMDLFTAPTPAPQVEEDDIEKLKALQALKDPPKSDDDTSCDATTDDAGSGIDPWEGIPHTIDLETGEYVLKVPEPCPEEREEPSALVELPGFSLEEALQLVGLDEEDPVPEEREQPDEPSMLQPAQFLAPRHFPARGPLARTVSMEQRWQDLAHLLSLPPAPDHYPAPYEPPRGALLHNATLAPPVGDLNSTGAYPALGSAVATSINLTNSSEPMGDTGPSAPYKLEAASDMMYYSNSSAPPPQPPEMGHGEGFLSSILNEDDLQLMDMAMTEGMYTMRMLDSGPPPTQPSDASSDSAVSSMGSERVASLSDGEWMETGSDSGHDHYDKYRPYDYGYVGAQKKHQMFGRRYFQEQAAGPHYAEPFAHAKPPELKYSCSVEFARQQAEPALQHVQHNHSYHLPAEGGGAMARPVARDKQRGRKADDEPLNRDEKRARAMNLPLPVCDIINLPMDEFNERLSKYDLSEAQLSLIRDIRRRGKNKVAAQNCRKRKLDQILSLADEVRDMRDRKSSLLREREHLLAERRRAQDKFGRLYRHVFHALRGPDGRPYSPRDYSLQQAADGSVLLVPRALGPDEEPREPAAQ